MATEDREDMRQAETATLKRKLTGPPRLLLGKTRTRTAKEDRPAAAEQTQTANMDEDALSEVNEESCRGRYEAAGDDIRHMKGNRRRWWRRFSPAGVCNRKQKNDGCVPPEGALQETDSTGLNNTVGTKGKKKVRARTWPTFKRFLTSSSVQREEFVDKDDDEPSMTFRKKMQKFFTKGGKRRSSGVPLENMEDMARWEESVAQVETVVVQMSTDRTPTEEELVCDISVTEEDLTNAINGSETENEVAEGLTNGVTDNVPVKDLMEVVSPEKDLFFCDATKVVLDANELLSTSTTSSQEASELHRGETTDETTSRSRQPSTNRPSIQIELVPPDDVTQEDEEEERWEDSSSSENHNHLLILLSFKHSEQQLVQTARSLVRAAMNAAVDQVTREQQSDCVHREPPGCRDHA